MSDNDIRAVQLTERHVDGQQPNGGKMTSLSHALRILIIDLAAVYYQVLFLRDQKIGVPQNPKYDVLVSALSQNGSSTFDLKLAFVGVNPEHEGQQKLSAYLRDVLGFIVDATDYRDAFVIPERDVVHDRERSYQRFSTRITYVLGLFANKRPEVTVVSDAFDLYYPLLDFVTNRGGKASLAYFRAGMEDRWRRCGLFDDTTPIDFIDLSDHAKQILGVDLGTSLRPDARSSGMGALRID